MNNINKSVLVTPADIEASIASEWYVNVGDAVVPDEFQPPVPAEHPLRLITLCVLVLKNGHTVTGESHCQDPDKFDAQIGRNEARKDAINKFWPMAVYAARQNQIAEKP